MIRIIVADDHAIVRQGLKMREPSIFPSVIPAQAGIQRLFAPKTLGPRLRGDDDSGGSEA